MSKQTVRKFLPFALMLMSGSGVILMAADDDQETPGTAGQASQHATVVFNKLASEQAKSSLTKTGPKLVHSPRRPLPKKKAEALKPAGPAEKQVEGQAAQKGTLNFAKAAAAQALAPPGPGGNKLVHSPRGAPGQPGAAGSPPGGALAPLGPSPQPAATFQALSDLGTSIPSDTNGAAGPNHLLVALNTEVAIEDRTGTILSRLTLDNFWKSLNTPAAPSTFDPKVLYDRFEKRWIFVSTADGEKPTSSLLIGVSQSDDPTAGWNLYRVDADPTDQGWLDYPSVGFNKNWIVVQGNLFGIHDDSFRSQIYVFDKADLMAGGVGKFKLITRADLGLTQAPEVNGDNSESMALVESVADDPSTVLKIFRIIGDKDNPKLAAGSVTVDVTSPGHFSSPGGQDFAPQKGTTRKFQTDDSRVQAVVSRNGLIWSVNTIFLPSPAAPSRSLIQWVQLDPAASSGSAAVKQSGRIDDPTGQVFRAFPSIAVNQNEDVLIGYSRFRGNEFAGCAYSFRKKTDPPNALRGEVVFKKGLARYFKTFGGNQNRWGDYSNTVVDPNGTDFWTIQVYAERPDPAPAGDSHYGTQWAQVKP
jgi:hypothetical protein